MTRTRSTTGNSRPRIFEDLRTAAPMRGVTRRPGRKTATVSTATRAKTPAKLTGVAKKKKLSNARPRKTKKYAIDAYEAEDDGHDGTAMAAAKTPPSSAPSNEVLIHPQLQSPLFRLPLELRLLIFDYVLSSTRLTVELKVPASKKKKAAKAKATNAITATETPWQHTATMRKSALNGRATRNVISHTSITSPLPCPSLTLVCRRLSADIGYRWLSKVVFVFDGPHTMLSVLHQLSLPPTTSTSGSSTEEPQSPSPSPISLIRRIVVRDLTYRSPTNISTSMGIIPDGPDASLFDFLRHLPAGELKLDTLTLLGPQTLTCQGRSMAGRLRPWPRGGRRGARTMFDELLDERETLMRAISSNGGGGSGDRRWWWTALRYVIPGPCYNYAKPASMSQEQRPRWNHLDTHMFDAKEELWPMIPRVTRRGPLGGEAREWYWKVDKEEEDTGNGVWLVWLKARIHKACGAAVGGGGGCGLWEEDTISDEIWKGGARYSLVVVALSGYGGGMFGPNDDNDDDDGDDGDENDEDEEEDENEDGDNENDHEGDEVDEEDYDKDGQRHASFDYMCEHHGVVGDCTGHVWRWTEDEMYDEEHGTDKAGKGKKPIGVP